MMHGMFKLTDVDAIINECHLDWLPFLNLGCLYPFPDKSINGFKPAILFPIAEIG